MPVCRRCNKDTGVIGGLSFNKQTGRCGKCENDNQQALGRFRLAFLTYCADGILTPQEWDMLTRGGAQEGLDKTEALNFIRNDALHFLERTLTIAAADGIITHDEQSSILRLKSQLGLPDHTAQPLLQRLAQLRMLSDIRQGKLPVVRPNVRLEADEICHLDTIAFYHKLNTKTFTRIQGQLVATSKKLYFLAPTGGTEINWSSLMRTYMQDGGIYLELSKKTGTGFYTMLDPWLAEAVIDTLVRLNKRELVAPSGAEANRRIPQEVKIAVWQRDQGRCVECRANDYLEYDHVIPFSKGGANTVGNVQLLCRRCNLKKSDRI